MSILIKGMEMPKNCQECDFCNEINFEGYLWFDYYCSVKDKSFDWDDDDNKPDWCPLVEIPTPHGDLVDLSDMVHPNDSMRRMTIDEQLRRTCEGWGADRKQYVVIEGSET